MSQATATAEHVPTAARKQAKVATIGPWAWARANLFGSVWSTAVTLALGYIILRVVFGLIEWGLVHAVWSVPYSQAGIADTAVCQNLKGIGACWAVLGDKYRLILFGAIHTRSSGARPSWCCCSSGFISSPACAASGGRSWCWSGSPP